jgi:hypothetical protein
MRVWTPEQLRAFLAHTRHDRLYALWLLVATTGMRRAELAGRSRTVRAPHLQPSALRRHVRVPTEDSQQNDAVQRHHGLPGARPPSITSTSR